MRGITSAAATLVTTAGLLGTSAWANPLTLEDVVLEGQLRFMAERPDPDAYRYEAHATIGPASLQNGMVTIQACHRQLDPNRRVVVAFNRERVQQIEILETTGVGRAWVEGHRVELVDVQRGGSVCIGLHSRALDSTGEGRWTLHAGPLMRRYLDGYLPMEARLRVTWPVGLLALEQTQPAPQPGVRLTEAPDGATLDITFAGRMTATWALKSAQP